MMMKYLLIIVLFTAITDVVYAQNSTNGYLDDAMLSKINKHVSVEALQFKKQLVSQKVNHERVDFCVDTFLIQHIQLERIEANSSTSAVNKTITGAISAYNSLLQDYYNKLDALLLSADKVSLANSKNAWLGYQNAEINLMGTLTKANYSGGGTIQTNIEAQLEEDLVVKRLTQVFNYYDTVWQNH